MSLIERTILKSTAHHALSTYETYVLLGRHQQRQRAMPAPYPSLHKHLTHFHIATHAGAQASG
jgi:hypothetical protein